ncbi:MAG: hypothetical protein ACI84C_000213, partial [Flavobacteriales bacterium]
MIKAGAKICVSTQQRKKLRIKLISFCFFPAFTAVRASLK